MSWDYHIALDAWPSIRRLDVDVQEAVLDTVEELCDEAEALGWSGNVRHRVYVNVGGAMHSVRLVLIANRSRRLLNLTDVEG